MDFSLGQCIVVILFGCLCVWFGYNVALENNKIGEEQDKINNKKP